MSWIPGWDSVAAAHSWSNFYFAAGIVALLCLGVFEVVSHRYTERKDELAAQEQSETQRRHDEEIARLHGDTAKANANLEVARRDIAVAQSETAKANERTAELKLALEREIAARQPRTISNEQQTTLVACLRQHPKGPVTVVPKTFDTEAEQYAAKIIEVLQEAGYEIRPPTGPRPFGFGQTGIFAVFNDAAHPPPHVGEIQFCLKQVGVELGGGANSDWVKDPDLVLIAVSQKP